MCVICRLYLYFSSMDKIHAWKCYPWFFPWVTFSSPDNIFPSMDDFDGCKLYPWIKFFIYGGNSYFRYFWKKRVISRALCSKTLIWKYDTNNSYTITWQIKISSMDEKILSMDKVCIRQNHPWVEKYYPEMKMSPMEKTWT